MTRPRTNICLNMIVKNEAAVLPRLFRSIKDYIDYFVIVDTGSTDDTVDLIKREMSAYGIHGEVHRRPWVNFGVNRQQALELALQAGRTDWVLFIDADEELGVADPAFYEKLEAGVTYGIEKHHAETRYVVPHLVDVRNNAWKWEGRVHNSLRQVDGSTRRTRLETVWIVYHPGEGAKSHGVTREEKFLRDARLLEEDLAANPDDARSQFYLGQSYKHAGRLEEAYEAYQRRVRMQGWDEETFLAQLELGRVAVALGMSEDIVVRDYLAAYDLRPRRAEPLHDLARYFRERQAYGRAYLFARVGVDTPRPADSLFVHQSVYEWRLLDELGVSAFWVARYGESKAACHELLRRVQAGLAVPAEDVRRIRRNLAFADEKIAPAERRGR